MKNLFILLLIMSLCCCKGTKEVQRVQVTPIVLNDSIMTTMPGDLLFIDSFLVWSDPFANDYFLHVHDMTGKKIGVMGKVGQGPEEFVSPMVSDNCYSRNLLVNDVNGNTIAYLSIDSLLKKSNPFIALPKENKEKLLGFIDYTIQIRNTKDNENYYFRAVVDEKESYFGEYPVREIKQHLGGYLAYDQGRELLAVTSFKLPYLALYKKTETSFNLLWDIAPDKNTYEISNGKIIPDKKIMGGGAICISKDYIIVLNRDRQFDDTDESTVGRDISKCPRTVFLYDFEGNLLKIVNLGMPIMRLAADASKNELYAIGANQDYMLVKFEL